MPGADAPAAAHRLRRGARGPPPQLRGTSLCPLPRQGLPCSGQGEPGGSRRSPEPLGFIL